IGVESSNPFGCGQFEGQPKCDQAAIDAGIARLRAAGVRTRFLTHWVDNALAGAAVEGGYKGTFIGAIHLSWTSRPFSTGPGQPHLDYPFRSFDRRVVFGRERTGDRTFDLNTDGVAHYGLLADLLADMQRQTDGRRAMAALFGSAAAYLRTWRLTGIA